MATSDKQVALSRVPRGPTSGMSRATRQSVAPFLQKLYEMVSDSATDSLISWSETGDSFYVLDHERVAHDVLPRWFKHNNFASFVRQLNMYGFHKVPNLQQGVLKSDSETETWSFEHPNFHRGQPDLLCLISRKKQAAERPTEDTQTDGRESSYGVPGLNGGSVLDVNSIVNGIAAIKRHQTAISADLNDLKTSNQHLWQEAIASRERHKKHQDTINRILKFLAGVFGNSTTARKGSPGDNTSHSAIPRKRQRLMIEAGTTLQNAEGQGPKREGADAENIPSSLENIDDDQSKMLNQYSVETPLSTVAPVSPSPSLSPSPSPFSANATESIPYFEDQHFEQPPNHANASVDTPAAVESAPFASPDVLDNATPFDAPTTFTNPSQMNMLAPVAQMPQEHSNHDAVFQALMNSPQQMQKLISLLGVQGYPIVPTADIPSDSTTMLPPHDDAVMPDQAFLTQSNPENLVPAMVSDPSNMSLLRNDDSASFGALLENSDRLQKSYKDAATISADVDALQASIDSLIENLGLNPSTLVSMNDNAEKGHSEDNPIFPQADLGIPEPSNEHMHPTTNSTIPEFDFDAFYREANLANPGTNFPLDGFSGDYGSGVFTNNVSANASPQQPSAFLDEVTSQSDVASPAMIRSPLDEPSMKSNIKGPEKQKGRKRRSGVETVVESEPTLTRAKRKR